MPGYHDLYARAAKGWPTNPSDYRHRYDNQSWLHRFYGEVNQSTDYPTYLQKGVEAARCLSLREKIFEK